MKPRPSASTDLQGDLFKVELDTIINPDHPLVRLAGQIDWAFFERELGAQFCDTNGAPAKPVRLMVGLHYLNHLCNLSDEQTVLRWVENPYWQHFCGMKWFEHTLPIDPSLMTRWRKKIGEKGAEALQKALFQPLLHAVRLRPQSAADAEAVAPGKEAEPSFCPLGLAAGLARELNRRAGGGVGGPPGAGRNWVLR